MSAVVLLTLLGFYHQRLARAFAPRCSFTEPAIRCTREINALPEVGRAVFPDLCVLSGSTCGKIQSSFALAAAACRRRRDCHQTGHPNALQKTVFKA